MDEFKVFVGIDVSKEWLDFATYSPSGGISYEVRCANAPAGISKVLRELRKVFGVHSGEMLFCLEHTGIYCAPFLAFASKHGLKAWQENPLKIRKAQQLRGKSDAMDARRIAEYAFRFRDRWRPWVPEPGPVARLRELLAIRDRLMRAAAMLKVPKAEARSLGNDDAVADMARFSDPAAKAIAKQLKDLEARIDALVDDEPAYKQNYELACSIPGIGRMTALSLILFTRNFTLFDDPRKLACYCGVAPFEHSSGSSIRGRTRVSRFANKALKRIMHMAAMAAIRSNADIKAYFKRKVEGGKNKMSVINAIRSKLLHCIMAVVRRKSPWLPKFSKEEENFASVS